MTKPILCAASFLTLAILLNGCERSDVATTSNAKTPSPVEVVAVKPDKAEIEKQEMESAMKASEAFDAQAKEAQAKAPKQTTVAAEVENVPVKWEFSTETDPMTSKESKYAIVSSENELNFGFPYSGGSSGTLTVRQRATDGLKVMFSISSGQIVCMLSCTVTVRFDDRPAMKFSGNPPADHGSTTVFLSPPSKFVNELKNSKKTLVKVGYYSSGEQISEFKTSGFEWGSKAKK